MQMWNKLGFSVSSSGFWRMELMENFNLIHSWSLKMGAYTWIHYHNVMKDSKDKATKKGQIMVNLNCFITQLLSPKMKTMSHSLELLLWLVILVCNEKAKKKKKQL